MKNLREPPEASFSSAAFADSLFEKANSQGIPSKDLFVAFAGIVGGLNGKLAADCLTALEAAIDGDANAETCAPSA
jgi:hypothetical protein